eukprot:1157908-Pelagomonas_calceolata.AAC.9
MLPYLVYLLAHHPDFPEQPLSTLGGRSKRNMLAACAPQSRAVALDAVASGGLAAAPPALGGTSTHQQLHDKKPGRPQVQQQQQQNKQRRAHSFQSNGHSHQSGSLSLSQEGGGAGRQQPGREEGEEEGKEQPVQQQEEQQAALQPFSQMLQVQERPWSVATTGDARGSRLPVKSKAHGIRTAHPCTKAMSMCSSSVFTQSPGLSCLHVCALPTVPAADCAAGAAAAGASHLHCLGINRTNVIFITQVLLELLLLKERASHIALASTEQMWGNADAALLLLVQSILQANKLVEIKVRGPGPTKLCKGRGGGVLVRLWVDLGGGGELGKCVGVGDVGWCRLGVV